MMDAIELFLCSVPGKCRGLGAGQTVELSYTKWSSVAVLANAKNEQLFSAATGKEGGHKGWDLRVEILIVKLKV
jgi:hypothetical protein